ncbi:MAG: hypothetical protein QOI39_4407, partial [Mycobacterium sp.]|nr:hypothetical protein [Mycobacterium sp.]
AFGSAVFLLAAALGKPYPRTWHARWSRHI